MFLKPVYTLLASNSHFACRALTRLCTAGVAPSTIALPGTVPSVLPIRHRSAAGTDIISLAFKYRVPLLDLPLQQPDAWPAMLSIGTDSCLLSTCFPARIPGSLWKTTACFNLHPSLLPAYRGPTPLFWQFHRGEHHTGVTLHRVNAEFDGGDIVSLKTLDLAPGIALRTVEAKLASLGTELFLTLLQTLRSAKSLPCRVQNRTRIQYNPAPGPDDYQISCHWSVDRAVRFVRGLETSRLYFHYHNHEHSYRFQSIQTLAEVTDPSPTGQTVPVQLADGRVLLTGV